MPQAVSLPSRGLTIPTLNATHASTTGQDALLPQELRHRREAGYMGHVLMENRHGLVVNTETTRVPKPTYPVVLMT